MRQCTKTYHNNIIIIIRKCLAVVLENLLKRELQEFVLYWNTHCIRYNRHIECPSGIPDDMYEMPEEFG